MVNVVLARKLFRDILSRKGSVLAVVAIVGVGIGSYVGFSAVYRDLDGARAAYYRHYRLADFSVNVKRAPANVVHEVAAVPNVREVRGRVAIGVRLDLPGHDELVSGTAISMPEERKPVLDDILLRSGTWFTGREQAILNEAFARANGLGPGSRIRVLLLDQEHDLLVVGTAMSPEFVYLIPGQGIAPDPARFGVVYLPERFLQEAADLDGAWNQLVGLAHDSSRTALDNTLKLIEEELDPYGVTHTTPVHELPSARFLADELRGLGVSCTIMPAIFLVVAALVLNVLMSRLVTQQRPVIGTLKALGYSSFVVARHYLAFGLVVGLAGGVAGLAFGRWLQGTMLELYRQFYAMPGIRSHFYPDVLLRGLAVCVAFGLVGTVRGVRYATRLEPAEAMRPPPPERGGRVFLERFGPLWRPLPFEWKMILRTIFRNPFRSTVSVVASVVATALLCSTLTMPDAIDFLMHYEFALVSHQDLTASLRDPRGLEAVAEVARLPGVAAVETELVVPCDLSVGSRRRRIAVIGLLRGSRLHTPLDAAGRPISPPDEGLVLTRKLAEVMGVGVGDVVTLRPLVGRRQRAEAVVVALVDSYLGLSAYADMAYLSRLMGEERCGNALLVAMQPGAERGEFLSALAERPSVVGTTARERALRQMEKTLAETLWISLLFLVLFAGLIAFGSVLNAALVSLSERQREAGTLRVLGYYPRQVAAIFSGESLLVNIVGIGLGVVAGVGLTHLLARAYDTELYRFPVVIRPVRIVQSALAMLGFVALAQLVVYRLVRRLNWIEVLKVKE